MRIADRRSRFPQADAVRLLLILSEAGDEPNTAEDSDSFIRVIRSQIAFLARDFWVRYPDYLAEELIDIAVEESDRDILQLASDLLDEPEIDFDWLPMIRWRNGAYWWMTDAIAILTSHQFLEYRPRLSATGIAEHTYLLTKTGMEFVERELHGVPIFDSIRRRSQLAGMIDPGAPGTKLKMRQYEVDEYSETTMGTTIPSRFEDVRKRLEEVETTWNA